MKKVATLLLVACVWISATAFCPKPATGVNWMTVAEMEAAYTRQPKPILVDVYTGWCGWCKVMDRETYSNKQVADYINKNYYPVKLDAESKEKFVWNNKTYSYNEQYKSNELAVWLLYGQMSYPSTVFLPTLDSKPAPMAGYLKPAELEAPLRFFGDGAFKSMSYQDYMKTYKTSWK